MRNVEIHLVNDFLFKKDITSKEDKTLVLSGFEKVDREAVIFKPICYGVYRDYARFEDRIFQVELENFQSVDLEVGKIKEKIDPSNPALKTEEVLANILSQ